MAIEEGPARSNTTAPDAPRPAISISISTAIAIAALTDAEAWLGRADGRCVTCGSGVEALQLGVEGRENACLVY